MERFINEEYYDKECMKMAMLKQEETFRHQVHELHRLYRVQKMLMNDLKRERGLERWIIENETASSSPPEKEDEGRDEESDLELTLGIGSRKKKKETSFTSDSGASFSSSSAESSGVKLNKGQEWGLFKSERKSGFNVEEEMRVKHPPWLFQCLSLNIT